MLLERSEPTPPFKLNMARQTPEDQQKRDENARIENTRLGRRFFWRDRSSGPVVPGPLPIEITFPALVNVVNLHETNAGAVILACQHRGVSAGRHISQNS